MDKKHYLIPELKYTPADVHKHPDIDLLVSYYSFLDMRDVRIHPFSNNNLILVFTSRERTGLTTFKNCHISSSDDKTLSITGNLIINQIEPIETINGITYYKTVVTDASVNIHFMKMDFDCIEVEDMQVSLNISDENGHCDKSDHNVAFLLSTYSIDMEQSGPNDYIKKVIDFISSGCIMQYDPIDDQSIYMPSKEQFLSYNSDLNKNYYQHYAFNLIDMENEIKRLKDGM